MMKFIMNTIKFETANLFDYECDILIGCGTLGFSIIGTLFKQFMYEKIQNESEVRIEGDRIVRYNKDKYYYFIIKDGEKVSNENKLSDKKLISSLDKVFLFIKEKNLKTLAMNILSSHKNADELEFLKESRKFYRIYLLMDYFNYITQKLQLDEITINVCDLRYDFSKIKYTPFYQNENNKYEFIPKK